MMQILLQQIGISTEKVYGQVGKSRYENLTCDHDNFSSIEINLLPLLVPHISSIVEPDEQKSRKCYIEYCPGFPT